MTAGDERRHVRTPESVKPWVTERQGFDAEPPWGVGEDDPMDEGSEETAVPEGRRGERRAEGIRRDPAHPAGRHGFGRVEGRDCPPEAGPGAPPEPTPARRSFPDDADKIERSERGLRARGRRSA